MNAQTTEKTTINHAESYLLIENEDLTLVVVSAQILSGCKIVLSRYENVVFSDCTFYATEFQGVTFKDCIFENCNFEFSHFKKCKFVNCNFNNCTWTASSSQTSLYADCDIQTEMDECLSKGQNQITHSREDHTTDIYIELAIAA